MYMKTKVYHDVPPRGNDEIMDYCTCPGGEGKRCLLMSDEECPEYDEGGG